MLHVRIKPDTNVMERDYPKEAKRCQKKQLMVRASEITETEQNAFGFRGGTIRVGYPGGGWDYYHRSELDWLDDE